MPVPGADSASRCLGKWASYLCSPLSAVALQSAPTAAVLQCARAKCQELQKLDVSSSKTQLPVEHLRAAEQHLAVVERWLTGDESALAGGALTVSTRSGQSSSAKVPTQVPEQAERLFRDLGLSDDLERGPEADEFWRVCAPHPPGEIFLKSISCSAKSRNFRYVGKIYISSLRICFHSNLVGVETEFALSWNDISSLRLMQEVQGNTFPVRISTKTEINFDGDDVKELDIRIFDFSGLGALHKSTMYFLGTDLFGMWQKVQDEPLVPAVRVVRSKSCDMQAITTEM
ncbi:unnamed protein product, partial [Polarella glacialis]